ncbi:serine/threonine protein kinase [Sphingomonas sp. URHD0057]|uniref:serine/threonine protein kinase n=1 Tax=Sphingomonas sp. URHD0057 TaxID=1380389 RepID=UPI00068439E8|nr:serine/threonine-protein kinase [Sphingomonas sp. URHD0057]
MNKAYSNKALPAGTVLREWRLEEVLGVGGFGIVYKARGIYFDELVAIKEYFPSSISDRDSEDTVVPIDSDAEEVHALGLKKFVEEAKLLWNLSTPTRHPNIVSVRSLFEIHGTAYMVMDFEDGVSLSRMLKQGRRFNERSLWNILRPIAQGLERAHRVGVLHRDIKPPNILINEDNRPVLIDFGSARFTTAEATSTNVTFHTPPYAAIEQYVKTYEQGPWTDIYALGVVMYECVTGEKPAEVLERLHAGMGNPLAGAKWPGYGKKFLAAIDAAMVVKPEDRPQSIGDWLATFGKSLEEEAETEDGSDDATRFIAQQVETEEIIPVGTTDASNLVETGVPADPKQVKFKRMGRETTTSKKILVPPGPGEAEAEEVEGGDGEEAVVAATPKAEKPSKKAPVAKESGSRPKPALLVGAGAIALLGAVGAAALFMRGGEPASTETVNATSDVGGNADLVLGGATPDANAAVDANAVGTEMQNAATAGQTVTEPDAAGAALRKEQAKATAAEARLAAIQKAQAKAAAQKPGTPAAATKTAATAPSAAASSESSGSTSGGVSSSKLSQFYGVVDSARGMARQVMRSGNPSNVQLARSYDANLKTLRDSIRGVNSDKDADRLIKQATQTRAYVQFLVKQSQ